MEQQILNQYLLQETIQVNGTGSLATFYNATEEVEGFATHSEFRPYVTTIGLYNDQNDLLVIGKLGKPIKNDDDLSLKFIVRFDV